MQSKFKKILSLFLALVMCLSMVPYAAFAEEEEAEQPEEVQLEEVQAPAEKEETIDPPEEVYEAPANPEVIEEEPAPQEEADELPAEADSAEEEAAQEELTEQEEEAVTVDESVTAEVTEEEQVTEAAAEESGSDTQPEAETPVKVIFDCEQSENLSGLQVFDAENTEKEPCYDDETGEPVYGTYFLLPGEYSYSYHDESGVYQDIYYVTFSVSQKSDNQHIQLVLSLSDDENTQSCETNNAIQNTENALQLLYKDEDYRQWSQGDERWGNKMLGYSPASMASLGCVVTSVTKLCIQCGLASTSWLNPGVMVDSLNENGGFTANGSLYWAKIQNVVPGFIYQNKIDYPSQADIIGYVREGYHVIIKYKNGIYGDHWVPVDEALTKKYDSVYVWNSWDITDTHTTNIDIPFGNLTSAGAESIVLYSGGTSAEYDAVKPSISNVYFHGYNSDGFYLDFDVTDNIGVGNVYLKVTCVSGSGSTPVTIQAFYDSGSTYFAGVSISNNFNGINARPVSFTVECCATDTSGNLTSKPLDGTVSVYKMTQASGGYKTNKQANLCRYPGETVFGTSTVIQSLPKGEKVYPAYVCTNSRGETWYDIGGGRWVNGAAFGSAGISNDVTRIEYDTFFNCSSITSLSLPASVTSIASGAFSSLRDLETIEVSASNPSFFSLGESLYKLKGTSTKSAVTAKSTRDIVPNSEIIWVSQKQSGVFNIPEGVTSIGDVAFSSCSELTGVTIPYGVTSIGGSAFVNCSNITDIDIPDSVTSLGSYAFYYCRGLTDIDIPAGITRIEERTFAACDSLTSITIPGSVTTIGEGAFSNCRSLSDVYFLGSEKEWNSISNGGQNDSLLNARIHFAPAGIKLSKDYAVLTVGDSFTLDILNVDDAWKNDLEWSVRNEAYNDTTDVISVENGKVTAVRPGTAYVSVSVVFNGKEYAARCRVDVTESPVAQTVNPVSLVDQAATSVIFSTEYAKISVLLEMEQLLFTAKSAPAESGGNKLSVMNKDTENYISLEKAVFEDPDTAAFFSLRVYDDRTLEIIPTDAAISNAASVKNLYQSAITVTVDGKNFTTDALSLSVKKTTPALKASAVKFNSSFAGDQRALTFSGGVVTDIRPVSALPEYMMLDADAMTITLLSTAPAKGNGKLTFNAAVEGWTGTYPVTVSYSIAATAPKLSFAQSSVTLNRTVEGTISESASVKIKSITPAEFSGHEPVFKEIKEGSTSYPNYTVLVCYLSYMDGVPNAIRLSWGPDAPADNNAHTYKVYYELAGKTFSFTVKSPKPAVPKMTLKASGIIETNVRDSYVNVAASFSNAGISYQQWVDYYISDKNGNETLDSKKFTIDSIGNTEYIIKANESKLPAAGTYYLTAKTEISGTELKATVKFTVKNTPAAKVKPTATIKASGNIDVIRPDKAVTITPAVKNLYNYKLTAESLKIYKLVNKNYELCDSFSISYDGKAFTVRQKGELRTDVKYYARLDVDETTSSKYTAVSVKMGSAKVAADVKTVTLLSKDRYSSGTVSLSTASAGLTRISGVTLDTASSKLFRLEDLGSGKYAITYKDSTSPNGLVSGTSTTAKLNVFLEGNLSSKANATVSIKVMIK